MRTSCAYTHVLCLHIRLVLICTFCNYMHVLWLYARLVLIRTSCAFACMQEFWCGELKEPKGKDKDKPQIIITKTQVWLGWVAGVFVYVSECVCVCVCVCVCAGWPLVLQLLFTDQQKAATRFPPRSQHKAATRFSPSSINVPQANLLFPCVSRLASSFSSCCSPTPSKARPNARRASS